MFGIHVDSFPTTIWDILTAIGTVGAVVVSLLFAWNESRRRKAAEAELRDERNEQAEAKKEAAKRERRAQAELVIAWYEPRPVETGVVGIGTWVEMRPRVVLVNHSKAPIFDVAAKVTDILPNETLPFEVIRVLPSTDSERLFAIPFGDEGAATKPCDWRAWVTFRDLAGVWWKRYESGELTELTADEIKKLSTGPALE